MRPLHLAFVWHLHQPYHKDDVNGTTLLPWVRLRAAKDYRKLAVLLADHPRLRQTFNLVPSLLVQLEDRTRGGGDDLFLRVSRKAPADLSAGERAFVLRWLRESTRLPRVRASPRYAELAGRAEHDVFSTGDLRDVQVWANLAWCGPHWVGGHPVLSELRTKDRDFTEDDKRAVLDAMEEEVARVIPAYRALARDGRAELTCSPLCHPILPLLVDLEAAREGTPAIDLPALPFRHPEDAARHVRAGRDYIERVMGVRPRGLWPPELAVGEQVERLVGEAGIDWMLSDEGVLARSLHLPSEPAVRRVADPELLYRPSQLTREGHRVSLVFRDAALSSLVGFDYPRMPAREAARDFLGRLRGVRDLQSDDDLLVTVALDGASPWDWYPREGQDFLEGLFDELDRAEDIVSTTVGEFLDGHPDRQPLGRLHAGSWIGANLDTWVGGPEHTRAWEQLASARQAVAERAQSSPRAAASRVPAVGEGGGGVNGRVEPNTIAAWRELMIAEGSDWFWWYSRRRSSGMDPYWDGRFRLHLRNAYRLLGEAPPSDLFEPNLPDGEALGDVEGWRPPAGECSPRDRDDEAWERAGRLEAGCGERAPVRPPDLVDRVLVGCDAHALHVRLDGRHPVADRRSWDVELWVYLSGSPPGTPAARVLDLPLGSADAPDGTFRAGTVVHVAGTLLTVCHRSEAGARPVVQRDLSDPWCFSVPFALLGRRGGERLQLRVATARQGRVVDELPFSGTMEISVPVQAEEPGAGPEPTPAPADRAASATPGPEPSPGGPSPEPLRVLIGAVQVAPFLTGTGEGQVATGLARALRAAGHDARLLLPRHRGLGAGAEPVAKVDIPYGAGSVPCTFLQTEVEGVPAYLVDSPQLFDRAQVFGYPDDRTRFGCLCRALVELLLLPSGFAPDVVHVHDWPLALVPGLIEEARGRRPDLWPVATVLNLHDLAHQVPTGVFALTQGIRQADRLTTVSEGYAAQIQRPGLGAGLEELLRERRDGLHGVEPGIDAGRFDPEHDTSLAAPFSAVAPGGKAQCRSDLRRELGLDDDARTPLVAYVGRFRERTGAGLVEGLLPHVEAARAQVAILGAGEDRYEERFREAAARWPARVSARTGFEEAEARRLLAGADLLLLPSAPKPGAMLPLLGLRYGAVPIVRGSAESADSLLEYDPVRETGTGFLLGSTDPWEVFGAVVRATETYRHVRSWSGLVRRTLSQDVSWARSAERCVEVYRAARAARRERAGAVA